MSIDNDLLHRGVENMHSPVYTSEYIGPIFFLSTFLSKISPQVYKIESSYLVYRMTATSCIVDRESAFFCLFLYIFVHFFSLYASDTVIFCDRFLSNCSKQEVNISYIN